ncbi:MAG: 5-dehydro-4-deoxy-D-glucuronate isomerase [Bacteroidota bacterium]|nr:5-dehydro-4-deoxy-D-glucuronate isomerase [Bacteroidota bacterium]
MEVRYAPNEEAYQRMTTSELRSAFVIENLFRQGAVTMLYSDVDRLIVGSAVPKDRPLTIEASKKEMAAEYFLERREIGVINIGGEGKIRADGKEFRMKNKDCLYLGKGVKTVECSSGDAKRPALYYFASFPAHQAFPTAHAKFSEASKTPLGSSEQANVRTITKFIHADGIKSCQLVMGLTELEKGSVWNTMPAHTHQRRMEVYLYFDMDDDSAAVHLMGKPNETRGLFMRNQQAVISPPWSIHCGAGTKSYSFVWAMGGENQEFSDMDAVGMKELM